MGLLSRLFGDKGRTLDKLAERLGVPAHELENVSPRYTTFTIPKRSGGSRTIEAPDEELKALQRAISRRLLARLHSHTCCVGFERGLSIVHNANAHRRRAVIVKMDIRDFFPSTTEKRVRTFFRDLGWSKEAAEVLTRITTHRGALPQGAPTSPRLANLVNFRMDARLNGLASKYNAVYTRYADDITFSLASENAAALDAFSASTRRILGDFGYSVHRRKKRSVRRRTHQQQRVCGLVVNEKVALPRDLRRRLRAIEHRLDTGRTDATLTREQLDGWKALQKMIETQREA